MKNLYLFITLCLFSVGYAQNPADKDPGFNQFSLPLGNYFVNEPVTNCRVQTDGKVLLVLGNKKLIRLNNNLLDTSFNTGTGFSGTDVKTIYGLETQTDGKIIVYGKFSNYNGSVTSNIVRLNSDGSIDTSFSTGTGFFYIQAANSALVRDLKILSNGKYLINGSFSTYNGANTSKVILLNTNGSMVTTNFFLGVDVAIKTVVQSNGQILVFGANSDVQTGPIGNFSRFSANGTYDSSFNCGSGFAPMTTSTYDNVFAVQSDGKIISGGIFSSYNGVAAKNIVRINTDGTLDTNFVTGTGFNGPVKSVYIQPDGKVIVGGDFDTYNGQYVRKLVRLNADGSIDSTFIGGVGSNGNLNSYSGVVNDIVKAIDGKLFFVGSFRIYNNEAVNYILKINSDGSKSSNFNNLCKGFDGPTHTFIQQPDGKLLVGGDFYSYNGITTDKIIRLNTDGSIDNSFVKGNNMVVNPQLKQMTIKLQSNGKILVSGSYGSLNGFACNNYLVRLNSDGSFDPSFILNSNTASAANDRVGTKIYLAVQDDDAICIAGGRYQVSSTNRIFNRLNADGSVDSSYYVLGIQFTSINKIELQNDGKLLVCGSGTAGGSMKRLLDSGNIDPSFNCTWAPTDFKVQSNGKIIITGASFSSPPLRINSNGTIDSSFNYPFSNAKVVNETLENQPDGKIILGTTNVVSPKPSYPNGLGRANLDGSLDSIFDDGTGFDGDVYSISQLTNGKIIVLGNFKTYNGSPENNIVCLMGEDFYFIQGENKLDLDNNGCDNNDIAFPDMRFQVSNLFNFTSNTSGNYRIGLISGNYTITPVLENPTYFNITPPSVTASFPSQGSSIVQNFCVTSNGVHSDLEVVLIPIGAARPGFDAKYKLIYKNKGNQVQSGTVGLTFNDAVLDLVSANPIVSSQTVNFLSWNFTNLNPFETREILVTLNLNSPLETPALNAGSVLNYTTNVTSAQTDEIPNDNTFTFNQTVVNSYDPNDKTCLQGLTVGTDKVGDYVHYVIRFENSGTYKAQNIAIKDVIDTNKFDINTLIPLSGSALFTTKISQGNNVEFLFENINLPFTAGTNTGYVAFKIKTKSTLVSGDTFGGLANIYFDYNSAITTNTYTTTIQALSVQDFAFGNYFSLYPNPVSDVLNISKKEGIEISSIHIYNVLGQLMMVIPNAKNTTTIDISNLSSGNYFVKINSDKGTSNTKFIKR